MYCRAYLILVGVVCMLRGSALTCRCYSGSAAQADGGTACLTAHAQARVRLLHWLPLVPGACLHWSALRLLFDALLTIRQARCTAMCVSTWAFAWMCLSERQALAACAAQSSAVPVTFCPASRANAEATMASRLARSHGDLCTGREAAAAAHSTLSNQRKMGIPATQTATRPVLNADSPAQLDSISMFDELLDSHVAASETPHLPAGSLSNAPAGELQKTPAESPHGHISPSAQDQPLSKGHQAQGSARRDERAEWQKQAPFGWQLGQHGLSTDLDEEEDVSQASGWSAAG